MLTSHPPTDQPHPSTNKKIHLILNPNKSAVIETVLNRSCNFRFGDLANITKAKEDLVRKLRLLMDEERRQLERDLATKLDQMELMKKRHQVPHSHCSLNKNPKILTKFHTQK
jgi:hypothetical protein